MPDILRHGSYGEPVRDVQRRLAAVGHPVVGDDAGVYGAATTAAVRRFQDTRGLRNDGCVGPETWAALVETGFVLGDRHLYLRSPMLRGDDVDDLQRRLNAMGFDAGREDGIFGPDTRRALQDFQHNAGLTADGICGSDTVAELRRLGALADGEVASVRERELLRQGPHRLAGRRVFVLTPPGQVVLGHAVLRALLEAGATAMLDASGSDDSVLAAAANNGRFDLVIALRSGPTPIPRYAYFASGRFRSEAGFRVATALHAVLHDHFGAAGSVCGKTYAILRETRMPAVVCELHEDGDVEGLRSLVAASGSIGRDITDAVRDTIERPET